MLPYKSSSLVHPLLSLTHWIFGSLMLPYKSSSLVHPLLSLTHWIFRSLMLPYKSSSLVHPLLSLTHWIFRSLMLPYKSSSLVQNVFAVHRFARGGRRLAVRKMKECHISAQPRTPFCHYVAFRPGGKHVTGFSGRFAFLQIQFLCHLKGKRENRWHWILCHI